MDEQDRQNYGYGYAYNSAYQQGYQEYAPTSNYPPADNSSRFYQQQPQYNQGSRYYQAAPPRQEITYNQEPQTRLDSRSPGQDYRRQSPQPQYEASFQSQGPQTSTWGNSTPISPESGSHRLEPHHLKNSKPDATEGLSKKFSDLMHHHKTKDHSSDSDSDKHRTAGDFATKPYQDSRYGPHPFSVFCPRDSPDQITFEIVNAQKEVDLLVSPNQDTRHPAYRIEHDDSGTTFKAYRCELPELKPTKAVYAGQWKWKLRSSSRVYMIFPWGKHDFHLTRDWWYSDVGLLDGQAAMKWILVTGPNTSETCSFAVRCFDTTTPSMWAVASVCMQNYKLGKLQINAQLVRTVEQLDEMVVVAMGVMCLWRDFVKVGNYDRNG